MNGGDCSNSEQVTAIQLLVGAVNSGDPDAVEAGINSLFTVGLCDDMAPILIDLTNVSWHRRHEDVASALQDLRPAGAVDALEEMTGTTHGYEVDDGRALARKCTWALADIGSPAARTALERIACRPDRVVAAFAQRRLDRWPDEIQRKRWA